LEVGLQRECQIFPLSPRVLDQSAELFSLLVADDSPEDISDEGFMTAIADAQLGMHFSSQAKKVPGIYQTSPPQD